LIFLVTTELELITTLFPIVTPGLIIPKYYLQLYKDYKGFLKTYVLTLS
jgi:hypothetical protein